MITLEQLAQARQMLAEQEVADWQNAAATAQDEIDWLTRENADLIHDNNLIMTACNAEVNEAVRLRGLLRTAALEINNLCDDLDIMPDWTAELLNDIQGALA